MMSTLNTMGPFEVATSAQAVGAIDPRDLRQPSELANILRTSAVAALDAELNSGASFFEALLAAARQVSLVTNMEGFELHSDGEIARIVHKEPDASRSMTEAWFVAVALRLRCIAGLTVPLVAVRFAHPAPAEGTSTPFDTLFGVDAEFDAPASELLFRSSVLEMRLGFGGSEAAPVSGMIAGGTTSEPDRLIERIREEIARMLFEVGTPVRLGPLARKFAMSTRSLQRRLGERSTSLSILIEEVRRDRAIELLSRKATLAEIAEQLRFASVPAFCRAFRHWTQSSPRAYQRTLEQNLEQRPSGIYERTDLDLATDSSHGLGDGSADADERAA